MTEPLEPRLHAYRPDLADLRLKDQVAAERYSAGKPFHVAAPLAPLRQRPASDAPLDTEALLGENLLVFEVEEGWAWAQLLRDGYVGYLPMEALAAGHAASSHRVSALRSFLYPGPSIKLPPSGILSYGAELEVTAESGVFAVTPQGFVYARHLTPLAVKAADFVAEAERFTGMPYLWGGKSSLGLDCSALVSLALAAAGISAPRDSDLQEAGLGSAVPVDDGLAGLQRGDLVFWDGHVGIMQDSSILLHANGHFMEVVSEPLQTANARTIARYGAGITSIRRLQAMRCSP
jgi:cell wall-associated NlpC family hydrolase